MTEDHLGVSLEAMSFYEDHPIDFCRDLIGVELDAWQKKAFDALVKDHFIAIRSGSGVGKTVFLSLATLWFISTKPRSKIPTTAPSKHQLEDLLWGEHHKWISRSKFLQNLLIWTATKVAVRNYAPQWYAVARTARVSPDGVVAEGLQGFHAEENLLFVIDECSGVHEAVFPAVEGALTGKKAYCILAGNPTRLTGYFHSVFNHLNMAGLYKLFHVSCYDSKFVEERYIRMMLARYGEDHPIFRIKVLGEFPSSEINTLISPEDIEKMRNNSPIDGRGQREEDIEIGIDIGRTIAHSVMCARKGYKIIAFDTKHLTGGVTDTIEITDWAIETIHSYNPSSFKVDCIGIGAGVYDNLRRLFPKIVRPVIGNAAVDPEKKDRYVNLRAQGYWELRGAIPYIYCENLPDRFISEIGDLRYKTPNGKILIESKEDMVKRCGRSPDYADAAMYAFIDSDICVDKHNIILVSVGLGTSNDEMVKRNIWATDKIPSQSGLFSRFDALNG